MKKNTKGQNEMFKDKDVICFLGDSITANGLWMGEVYQTLRKKYRVKCYNIGVPGGRISMAEKCLYSRCLAFNPDYVTVSFGINDVDHTYYRGRYENLTEDELKEKAFEIYNESYERVIQKIIAFGAQPIICIPSPYDDVNEFEKAKDDTQVKIDRCIEFIKGLATKYNCPVVDFKSVMQPMLKEHDLIREDRVHPTDEGQHIMAQTFLRDMGEISEIDFDTPFEFEEWNKKRYDKEQELRWFNFVEYCAFIDNWAEGKSTEEKKAAVLKSYEGCEDKTTGVAGAYRDYPKILDTKEVIMEEIISLTI